MIFVIISQILDRLSFLWYNICIRLIIAIVLLTSSYLPILAQSDYPYRVFLPQFYTTVTPKFGLSGSSALQTEAIGGSWFYYWGPQGQGTDSVEFVPMILGPSNIGDKIISNGQWLLGFNEPDLQQQADIRLEDSPYLWKQIEELYPNKKLGSPAPSHLDIQWLECMRNAYIAIYGIPPRFDALIAHSYRATADETIADLQIYIRWAKEWGVKEVWLTEFAFLPGWNSNYKQEIEKFIKWAENEPILTRYSPFIAYIEPNHWSWPTDNPLLNLSLFTMSGGLEFTELGKLYAK